MVKPHFYYYLSQISAYFHWKSNFLSSFLGLVKQNTTMCTSSWQFINRIIISLWPFTMGTCHGNICTRKCNTNTHTHTHTSRLCRSMKWINKKIFHVELIASTSISQSKYSFSSLFFQHHFTKLHPLLLWPLSGIMVNYLYTCTRLLLFIIPIYDKNIVSCQNLCSNHFI